MGALAQGGSCALMSGGTLHQMPACAFLAPSPAPPAPSHSPISDPSPSLALHLTHVFALPCRCVALWRTA